MSQRNFSNVRSAYLAKASAAGSGLASASAPVVDCTSPSSNAEKTLERRRKLVYRTVLFVSMTMFLGPPVAAIPAPIYVPDDAPWFRPTRPKRAGRKHTRIHGKRNATTPTYPHELTPDYVVKTMRRHLAVARWLGVPRGFRGPVDRILLSLATIAMSLATLRGSSGFVSRASVVGLVTLHAAEIAEAYSQATHNVLFRAAVALGLAARVKAEDFFRAIMAVLFPGQQGEGEDDDVPENLAVPVFNRHASKQQQVFAVVSGMTAAIGLASLLGQGHDNKTLRVIGELGKLANTITGFDRLIDVTSKLFAKEDTGVADRLASLIQEGEEMLARDPREAVTTAFDTESRNWLNRVQEDLKTLVGPRRDKYRVLESALLGISARIRTRKEESRRLFGDDAAPRRRPVFLVLSGLGGVGKSHLINDLWADFNKVLLARGYVQKPLEMFTATCGGDAHIPPLGSERFAVINEYLCTPRDPWSKLVTKLVSGDAVKLSGAELASKNLKPNWEVILATANERRIDFARNEEWWMTPGATEAFWSRHHFLHCSRPAEAMRAERNNRNFTGPPTMTLIPPTFDDERFNPGRYTFAEETGTEMDYNAVIEWLVTEWLRAGAAHTAATAAYWANVAEMQRLAGEVARDGPIRNYPREMDPWGPPAPAQRGAPAAPGPPLMQRHVRRDEWNAMIREVQLNGFEDDVPAVPGDILRVVAFFVVLILYEVTVFYAVFIGMQAIMAHGVFGAFGLLSEWISRKLRRISPFQRIDQGLQRLYIWFQTRRGNVDLRRAAIFLHNEEVAAPIGLLRPCGCVHGPDEGDAEGRVLGGHLIQLRNLNLEGLAINLAQDAPEAHVRAAELATAMSVAYTRAGDMPDRMHYRCGAASFCRDDRSMHHAYSVFGLPVGEVFYLRTGALVAYEHQGLRWVAKLSFRAVYADRLRPELMPYGDEIRLSPAYNTWLAAQAVRLRGVMRNGAEADWKRFVARNLRENKKLLTILFGCVVVGGMWWKFMPSGEEIDTEAAAAGTAEMPRHAAKAPVEKRPRAPRPPGAIRGADGVYYSETKPMEFWVRDSDYDQACNACGLDAQYHPPGDLCHMPPVDVDRSDPGYLDWVEEIKALYQREQNAIAHSAEEVRRRFTPKPTPVSNPAAAGARDAKARRRPLVGGPRPGVALGAAGNAHLLTDLSSSDEFDVLIKRLNQAMVLVENCGSHVFGIAIGGRDILTVGHIVHSMDDVVTITESGPDGSKSTYVAQPIVRYANRDFMILEVLDDAWAPRKDIRKWFAPMNAIPSKAKLGCYRVRGGGVVVTGDATLRHRKFRDEQSGELTDGPIWMAYMQTAIMPLKAGECGNAVFGLTKSGSLRIMGIYIGGCEPGALFTMVTQGDVSEDGAAAQIPRHVLDEDTPYVEEIQLEKGETVETITYPPTDFVFRGECEDSTYLLEETPRVRAVGFVPSLFKPAHAARGRYCRTGIELPGIDPDAALPAPTSIYSPIISEGALDAFPKCVARNGDQLPSIVAHQLNQVNRPEKETPSQVVLDFVEDVLVEQVCRLPHIAEWRAITLDEALNGMDHSDIGRHVKAVKTDATPGFPWNRQFKTKGALLERQESGRWTIAHPPLESAVDSLLIATDEGANWTHPHRRIIEGHLKVEVVRADKARAAKTRLFLEEDMAVFLRDKMLFGALQGILMEDRWHDANHHTTGIDPHSEMHRLYRHLREAGEIGADLDWDRFDKRLPFWVYPVVARALRRVCERNGRDSLGRMVEQSIAMSALHFYLLEGNVYLTVGDFPSGCFLTNIGDSFWNDAMLIAAIATARNEAGMPQSIEDPNLTWVWYTHGDDVVVVPPEDERQLIVKLPEIVSRWGMGMTDGRKNAIPQLSPIEELTFIGRFFAESHPVLGRLREFSLARMISWTEDLSVLPEVADTFALELAKHPRERYDLLVYSLRDQLLARGTPWVPLTWTEQRTRIAVAHGLMRLPLERVKETPVVVGALDKLLYPPAVQHGGRCLCCAGPAAMSRYPRVVFSTPAAPRAIEMLPERVQVSMPSSATSVVVQQPGGAVSQETQPKEKPATGASGNQTTSSIKNRTPSHQSGGNATGTPKESQTPVITTQPERTRPPTPPPPRTVVCDCGGHRSRMVSAWPKHSGGSCVDCKVGGLSLTGGRCDDCAHHRAASKNVFNCPQCGDSKPQSGLCRACLQERRDQNVAARQPRHMESTTARQQEINSGAAAIGGTVAGYDPAAGQVAHTADTLASQMQVAALSGDAAAPEMQGAVPIAPTVLMGPGVPIELGRMTGMQLDHKNLVFAPSVSLRGTIDTSTVVNDQVIFRRALYADMGPKLKAWTRLHRYMQGRMNYSIKIVVPSTVAGRIMVAVVPDSTMPVSEDYLLSRPHAYIDLQQGSPNVKFEVSDALSVARVRLTAELGERKVPGVVAIFTGIPVNGYNAPIILNYTVYAEPGIDFRVWEPASGNVESSKVTVPFKGYLSLDGQSDYPSPVNPATADNVTVGSIESQVFEPVANAGSIGSNASYSAKNDILDGGFVYTYNSDPTYDQYGVFCGRWNRTSQLVSPEWVGTSTGSSFVGLLPESNGVTEPLTTIATTAGNATDVSIAGSPFARSAFFTQDGYSDIAFGYVHSTGDGQPGVYTIRNLNDPQTLVTGAPTSLFSSSTFRTITPTSFLPPLVPASTANMASLPSPTLATRLASSLQLSPGSYSADLSIDAREAFPVKIVIDESSLRLQMRTAGYTYAYSTVMDSLEFSNITSVPDEFTPDEAITTVFSSRVLANRRAPVRRLAASSTRHATAAAIGAGLSAFGGMKFWTKEFGKDRQHETAMQRRDLAAKMGMQFAAQQHTSHLQARKIEAVGTAAHAKLNANSAVQTAKIQAQAQNLSYGKAPPSYDEAKKLPSQKPTPAPRPAHLNPVPHEADTEAIPIHQTYATEAPTSHRIAMSHNKQPPLGHAQYGADFGTPAPVASVIAPPPEFANFATIKSRSTQHRGGPTPVAMPVVPGQVDWTNPSTTVPPPNEAIAAGSAIHRQTRSTELMSGVAPYTAPMYQSGMQSTHF